jgi:hypothetical protein
MHLLSSVRTRVSSLVNMGFAPWLSGRAGGLDVLATIGDGRQAIVVIDKEEGII